MAVSVWVVRGICKVNTLSEKARSWKPHVESCTTFVNLFRRDAFCTVEEKFNQLSQRLTFILFTAEFNFGEELLLHRAISKFLNLSNDRFKTSREVIVDKLILKFIRVELEALGVYFWIKRWQQLLHYIKSRKTVLLRNKFSLNPFGHSSVDIKHLEVRLHTNEIALHLQLRVIQIQHYCPPSSLHLLYRFAHSCADIVIQNHCLSRLVNCRVLYHFLNQQRHSLKRPC